jgi:aspartokinase
MDGLTLASGLVEVILWKPAGPPEALGEFARFLAQHRINMNLFLGALLDGVSIVSCVSEADRDRLDDLMDSSPVSGDEVEWHGRVGLISLFPHRSSLKALGAGIMALARAHIPVGGFCSSLSAVTFIVEQAHHEKALLALAGCFEVPDARIHRR